MFCSKCGSQVPDGSAFCPQCGAQLAAATAPQAPVPQAAAPAPAAKPAGSGKKLLFVAKRSVWACSKRVVSSIFVAVITLFMAIALILIGSANEGGNIYIYIGIACLVATIAAIVLLVVTIIEAKHYRIEFYDGRVVVKSGLFNTREDQSIMTPIIGVRIVQTVWGKIFNYGSVVIDKTGKGWDIATTYLKNPKEIKQFLESLIDNTDISNINMFISN